jgi:DNA polymerase III subunit beta
MEFKVNNKVLEKLLSKVIPAVPSRTPMPVLENFLFDIKDGLLTVNATDLEISIRSSINVAADENIKMIVPAKLLYDVIRTFGDSQIHFITQENSKLNLKTENGVYSISYSPHEDFPEIPQVPTEKEVVIKGSELKKAIDQTAFAMSKEDMRPAMTGTLMEFSDEGLRFVATDGHRLVKLVYKPITSKNEEQFVIPERTITVLSKLLSDTDVKIHFSKAHISVHLGDVEVISRLIGEKYPSYNSVIPLENENLMEIKTDKLQDTVRRMMLFSTSNSKQVKFSINKNSLKVSAEDSDRGSNAEENLECSYKGDLMEIGFNTAYVNDILTHINTEDVIFKLHSPTKACIIEPSKKEESEELMMLLMPVRLNN